MTTPLRVSAGGSGRGSLGHRGHCRVGLVEQFRRAGGGSRRSAATASRWTSSRASGSATASKSQVRSRADRKTHMFNLSSSGRLDAGPPGGCWLLSASAGAGKADLDCPGDHTGLECRLRRRRRAAGHGSVGEPEDAAVPGAGEAAVGQFAIGQWPGHMAAAVGENVYVIAGADGDYRDLAHDLADRLALGKLVPGRQVMPAWLQD